MRLRFACAAAAAMSLAAAGCAPPVARPAPTIRNMGEHVEVGSLIYTVMETAWLDQLGPQLAPRLPERRFLEVRISVTNSGAGTAAIPEAALLDGRKAYPELTSGYGLGGWLGLLRTAEPAQTVSGSLLFDAPLGKYVLRLGECNNPDEIRTGLVELPLELPPHIQPVPGGLE